MYLIKLGRGEHVSIEVMERRDELTYRIFLCFTVPLFPLRNSYITFDIIALYVMHIRDAHTTLSFIKSR